MKITRLVHIRANALPVNVHYVVSHPIMGADRKVMASVLNLTSGRNTFPKFKLVPPTDIGITELRLGRTLSF